MSAGSGLVARFAVGDDGAHRLAGLELAVGHDGLPPESIARYVNEALAERRDETEVSA